MNRLTSKFVGFIRDEQGTETLEWGLVCGLIVVGAIIAITSIGPRVTDLWNDVSNQMEKTAPTK